MKYLIFFTATFFGLAASAQNALKISSGATFTSTGDAIITLNDMDLVNDGTLNQAAGAGTFLFTGISNNSISGSSTSTIDKLTISKTGSGRLNLLRDVNIATKISFISGLIDMVDNNIVLAPAATLAGESEASRITATGTGRIGVTYNLGIPTSANPGNLGAVFTSSSNMGSSMILRGHKAQNSAGGSGTGINRFYDIIPTNNAGLNATFRFKYFDAELNNLDENVLNMWKSTDNINWQDKGFTTRDIAGNFAELTGISDFSRWTLSPSGALPVQFVSVLAGCLDEGVNVQWSTASEQNSKHFEVQRSDNASLWVTIATIPAAGYSSTFKQYSYVDKESTKGNLYRLAEVDINGRLQLSKVAVSNCASLDAFATWPNPVHEDLNISLFTDEISNGMIKVYDAKGALVAEKQLTLTKGTNTNKVNLSRLPAGSYIINVTWNNGVRNKVVKVVKE